MTTTKVPDVGKTNEFIQALSAYMENCGVILTHSPDGSIVGVKPYTNTPPHLSERINSITGVIEAGMAWENFRQWVLGDLCNLGFKLAGEELAQRLPADKTLINWSSICSQYTHAERLFNLPFSHYAECAYIADKRARANLLHQAQEKNWTVQELRQARNLDAGNPTPQIDYEFTVWNSVTTADSMLRDGFKIDAVLYEELVAKYGRGELTVKVEILGRK